MTDQIDTGGPAFPIETTATPYAPGMSLRDWFAGQALAGYTASGDINPYGTASPESLAKIASWAYRVSDAMIAARSVPHD